MARGARRPRGELRGDRALGRGGRHGGARRPRGDGSERRRHGGGDPRAPRPLPRPAHRPIGRPLLASRPRAPPRGAGRRFHARDSLTRRNYGNSRSFLQGTTNCGNTRSVIRGNHMTRNRDAEVARRNRQELIAAKLGRRDLMKLGLLTASGLLVAKRGLSARVAGATSSPPTTPFIAPLPIPPVLEPQASMTPAPQAAPNPGAGEARLGVHQRWDEFLPKELYEVHAREAQHSFHPELPLNTVWGYDGIVPGPTYHATYGLPVLVRMHNELPPDHVGFGIPQITTHLHNGHTPSESDGFPADFFDSGFFYDQHYPNVCAGFDASPPAGDVRETMNTLWYHDHRFDFTAQNVYKGLAGFYLLFDEVDSGDETDPIPRALRLPSGEFDVPLMFADKVFDADGQVFFDFFNLDGILGDKFIVDGAIQPFFKVARRKYRFRLLDTGPSRFYEFFLSNGQPFVQISNDGNLLPQPLPRTSVRLGVAQRADLLV